VKCNHNRSIEDKMNGVVNLGEQLDEGAHGFLRALLDDVEVGIVARLIIDALEVGHKLVAQLQPGVKGPLGQVHEPRWGYSDQGNREVVGHNGLIPPPCRKDRGRVDLHELDGVDDPVVLLWQV
jgi:hypothetical protein